MVADTRKTHRKYEKRAFPVFTVFNSGFGFRSVGEAPGLVSESITATVWQPWNMAPTVRQWKDMKNGN